MAYCSPAFQRDRIDFRCWKSICRSLLINPSQSLVNLARAVDGVQIAAVKLMAVGPLYTAVHTVVGIVHYTLDMNCCEVERKASVAVLVACLRNHRFQRGSTQH